MSNGADNNDNNAPHSSVASERLSYQALVEKMIAIDLETAANEIKKLDQTVSQLKAAYANATLYANTLQPPLTINENNVVGMKELIYSFDINLPSKKEVTLPFSSVHARGLMQEYVIIAKRVTDNKDLTISDFQSVLEEALLIEKDKRPTVTTKLNRMKTAELLSWDIGETKSVSIGLGKKAEEHARAIYNRFLSQADVKELDKIIVKLQLQKIS